jgi:hemoglobin
MSSVTSKPTLYDRLGGVYSIAAVVDDFIDRVMHNPVLNANAAIDEAHHRVSDKELFAIVQSTKGDIVTV